MRIKNKIKKFLKMKKVIILKNFLEHEYFKTIKVIFLNYFLKHEWLWHLDS